FVVPQTVQQTSSAIASKTAPMFPLDTSPNILRISSLFSAAPMIQYLAWVDSDSLLSTLLTCQCVAPVPSSGEPAVAQATPADPATSKVATFGEVRFRLSGHSSVDGISVTLTRRSISSLRFCSRAAALPDRRHGRRSRRSRGASRDGGPDSKRF